MDKPWTQRQRPERLERRIEFPSYESNRDFLDRLTTLSEQTNRYPDISFGRTYVNITIALEDDQPALTEADHAFAAAIDGLLE